MWWRGTKIGMTIVGTTIGAGFASGREIWEFFSSYGIVSHWGILLSMILFSLCSMIILFISWKYEARNYFEVLVVLMGRSLGRLFDKLMMIFILSSAMIMLAGSGATFQQWNLSFWLGVLFMVFAVLFVLIYDVKGLMSLNLILMPVLSAILLYVCYRFFVIDSQMEQTSNTLLLTSDFAGHWPSAILYASLNIVTLVAVLSTFGREIKSPGDIWVGGSISALLLGGVAALLNQALIQSGEENAVLYDIPLFSLVDGAQSSFIILVSVVLWLAIYTTAVSGVYGVSYRLSERWGSPLWLVGGTLMVLLVPLTQFGFANLVSYLYPLYGIINLFMLSTILLFPIRMRVVR